MPFVRDTGTGACEDKQGLRPSSWVSDGSLMGGCLPCAALACVAGDMLCGHQATALEEAFFFSSPNLYQEVDKPSNGLLPSWFSIANSFPAHPRCCQSLQSVPKMRGWL